MAQTGPVVWVPSAIRTNPVDGTVVCDSGLLSRGFWLFGVVGETDTSFVYELFALNANKRLALRRPAAGDVDLLIPNQAQLDQNESVQVRIVGNPTAILQLTLWGVLIN